MTTSRYLQLDVFCARAGGGNPLGTVIGADDWSGEDMQRFATWTNLVETTFVLAPTKAEASYRLRIFTPGKEIPFAGHPTIGSAHAVLETGFAQPHGGLLVQECAAGLLPVRVEGDGTARRLFVQAPGARVIREGVHVDPVLSYLLRGIALGALPPACVEGGRRWWVAEFASEAALRGWQPEHASIGTLARETDTLGLCAFARCANGTETGYDLVVRAFPAGVGIVEDPASGAANGLIAAWIALREPQGALARGYRVSQGREIGRDASIQIRIDSPGPSGKAAVWVGGQTHTVIDGRAGRLP
ncbi:PhzF family phenazine biosynthesis protein [Dokdonella sp.]|uniref:PhzF family phenazine biosynthesis protein n=1 Tax=Dokdonella sp. TaxID=2291710 RepID=UPI001B0E57E6|nr:PhzF family phenazine biosynthesis protein [Dokdonella sp.]MBO9662818.1 PhzF family phenazine biosynthesis protein [Dokdonella sp.]